MAKTNLITPTHLLLLPYTTTTLLLLLLATIQEPAKKIPGIESTLTALAGNLQSSSIGALPCRALRRRFFYIPAAKKKTLGLIRSLCVDANDISGNSSGRSEFTYHRSTSVGDKLTVGESPFVIDKAGPLGLAGTFVEKKDLHALPQLRGLDAIALVDQKAQANMQF